MPTGDTRVDRRATKGVWVDYTLMVIPTDPEFPTPMDPIKAVACSLHADQIDALTTAMAASSRDEMHKVLFVPWGSTIDDAMAEANQAADEPAPVAQPAVEPAVQAKPSARARKPAQKEAEAS